MAKKSENVTTMLLVRRNSGSNASTNETSRQKEINTTYFTITLTVTRDNTSGLCNQHITAI